MVVSPSLFRKHIVVRMSSGRVHDGELLSEEYGWLIVRSPTSGNSLWLNSIHIETIREVSGE